MAYYRKKTTSRYAKKPARKTYAKKPVARKRRTYAPKQQTLRIVLDTGGGLTQVNPQNAMGKPTPRARIFKG